MPHGVWKALTESQLELDRDCAVVCTALGDVLARGTAPNAALLDALLGACIASCGECAKECDKKACQDLKGAAQA